MQATAEVAKGAPVSEIRGTRERENQGEQKWLVHVSGRAYNYKGRARTQGPGDAG